MKKILNFLMVMLLVMGLGMASVMTAVQAEAAETAETAGETVSAAETVLTANQDGEAAADASMSASGIYDEADLLSADEEAPHIITDTFQESIAGALIIAICDVIIAIIQHFIDSIIIIIIHGLPLGRHINLPIIHINQKQNTRIFISRHGLTDFFRIGICISLSTQSSCIIRCHNSDICTVSLRIFFQFSQK